MVSTYSSLNYHLAFSPKNCEPWLIESVCDRLWPYLGGIARENGMKPSEIDRVADYVHIFVSVPATMVLSKAMQLTKGGSSHWIKDFGRRYATRFAFGVVKPALKRGATLGCRYRGKVQARNRASGGALPLANAACSLHPIAGMRLRPGEDWEVRNPNIAVTKSKMRPGFPIRSNPSNTELRKRGRKRPGFDILRVSAFSQIVSDFGVRYSDFLAGRKLDLVASNFTIQGL